MFSGHGFDGIFGDIPAEYLWDSDDSEEDDGSRRMRDPAFPLWTRWSGLTVNDSWPPSALETVALQMVE